jgi:CRISPR-associated endonuclease/helicase Cas3
MKGFNNEIFIAHVRESDGEQETVMEHLLEVSALAQRFASKIALPLAGALIGLTHDLGKYSSAFQEYIHASAGLFGPEEKKREESRKEKVDHSTAGAQYIWDKLGTQDDKSKFAAQILATCVASHHTGLLDFVSMNGLSRFEERMMKAEEKTHRHDATSKADPEVMQRLTSLISSSEIVQELINVAKHASQLGTNELLRQFHYGLLTRFLFSCLIDADRLSAANFESPQKIFLRNTNIRPDWGDFVQIFEKHFEKRIAKSLIQSPVAALRQAISDACVMASTRPTGVFTLSVPTGGGKTLASLRFALHHARHHLVIERIIYVVPYTSIIEQNAQIARDYLGDEYVIEHHSNIVKEKDSWRNRVLSENWDAPVVFTTSVQFLNSLFSSGTSDARRMHQLANSIIIFDEIQTLPIKTVHLFNNAINFLTNMCKTSVVLCTATQPLLNKVDHEKGTLHLNANSELIADPRALFASLRRTQVVNRCKPGGWTTEETADLALAQAKSLGSVLVIVNTKKSACDLYKILSNAKEIQLYHLSTNMCPAHRKYVLKTIRNLLDSTHCTPIICISTQLIEAGVDVDFGSVIRFLAGLDSIAQAAGRCNRHGRQEQELAPVFIVNPAYENLDNLTDIRKGQEITARILDEWESNPAFFDHDLLSPVAMNRFYEYYFYSRREEMDYPVSSSDGINIEARTTLLALLSLNGIAVESYKREQQKTFPLFLRHGFNTAGEAFQVIDAPTQAILVRYGNEGKQIIDDLVSAFNRTDCSLKEQSQLLRRAQQYSVNLFPCHFDQLFQKGAIYEIKDEFEIYYLDEQYYSDEFGVSFEEIVRK